MSDDFEALQDIILEDNQKPKNTTTQNNNIKVLELLKKEFESKINIYKNKITALEKELSQKDQTISILNTKQQELIDRVQNLQELLNQKIKENEELINIKTNLEKELEEFKHLYQEAKDKENAILNAIDNINNLIKQRQQLSIEELQSLVEHILDDLCFKCNVDIKSIIEKILEDSKIFRDFIILKSNKTFIDNFKPYAKHLKVDIEFIEDGNMQEGEFLIDSKDFFLERINKDIIKDAIEKALQNIR